MKRILLSLPLLLLVAACDGKNPAPIRPPGYSASPGAADTAWMGNAVTDAPQSTTPKTDSNPVNCQTCIETCFKPDPNDTTHFLPKNTLAELPPLCAQCSTEIAGCDDDFTAPGTVYKSDFRGMTYTAGMGYGIEGRMDGYSNFRFAGGRAGLMGQMAQSGVLTPFRSSYFQRSQGTLGAGYCGPNRMTGPCTRRVYSEQFLPCRRAVAAADEATLILEQGGSPQQAYLTLERARPSFEGSMRGTSVGEAFSGILTELKTAAKGMAMGYAGRAQRLVGYSTQRYADRLSRMAEGANYLAYQSPGDPCEMANPDIQGYRIACVCTVEPCY